MTILLVSIMVICMLAAAGCTQPQGPPATTQATTVPTPAITQPTAVPHTDTVKLGDTTLGKVLTDANGMTLYFFVTDLAGQGVSTCYGNCSRIWPIFSVNNTIVSFPLNASDFSSINRTDGTKQTTYKGWPLYYFASDTTPGDVKGENVLKVWFVAKTDYTVFIASRPVNGSYLTDGTGRALYILTRDTPGNSSCNGTCIVNWPPFNADALILPSLLNKSDFTPVTRTDGIKQIAYMGRPLYYYSADKDAGDLNGQGFNNVWFAANVSGTFPAAPPTATTVTTMPTTISYYGNGGGNGY
jgi:predicted lipoprotein with Yx(FWY)xxD motif